MSEPRLTELAEVARRSMRPKLQDVVACGEALREAHDILPAGEWQAWCRENIEMDKGTVSMYIRIAHFSEDLQAAGIDSVSAARAYLRANGLHTPASNTPVSDAVVFRVHSLSELGCSQRQIARHLGIGKATVGRVLNGPRHARPPRATADTPNTKASTLPASDDSHTPG